MGEQNKGRPFICKSEFITDKFNKFKETS
jgi:hypothetical protein